MANWKKIILKDDNAELATVTASQGLRITTIPTGGSGDNVMVVTTQGHVKSISQGSVSGVDTTYTSSGTNKTTSACTPAKKSRKPNSSPARSMLITFSQDPVHWMIRKAIKSFVSDLPMLQKDNAPSTNGLQLRILNALMKSAHEL